MKKVMLFLTMLLFTRYLNAGEFHFGDCVEITGGFYYRPEQRFVGEVYDVRNAEIGKEYRVGSIVFGVWISEKNLKKVDDAVCKEAEKK